MSETMWQSSFALDTLHSSRITDSWENYFYKSPFYVMSPATKRSAFGRCVFAHSLSKIIKESNSFQQPSVSCLVKVISVTRNLTSDFSGIFSGSFYLYLVMLEVACSCHGPDSGQSALVLNPALRSALWTCLLSWVLVLGTAEAITERINFI